MSELKLHLGCGKRFIPGFIHIDRKKFDHVDHIQCIELLPQFADDSVDLIYASHALAYMKKPERAMKEWRRVLKPGGILRLATPDFAKLCEVYMKEKKLHQVQGPIYGHWDDIQHYTCYDLDSLHSLSHIAGFKSIREYDWRETEHADIDDYSQAYIPHLDKEFGTLISLNVECIK